MSPTTRLMIAAALVAVAAAGCSQGASGPAGSGVVQGHLYGVGGPAPGSQRPWAGTVLFDGGGRHADVAVEDDGSFSITLGPGRYTVTGRTPGYQDGQAPCHPESDGIEVTANATTTVDVFCHMK